MRPRTFVARDVGKLPCGSQPTAPTCVETSWCVKECFCARLTKIQDTTSWVGSIGSEIHGLVPALMKFSAILYTTFLWIVVNQCLVDFVFTINCVQVLLRLVYNVYLVCTLKLILYNSVLNRTSNTYCRVVFSCMLLCAFTALLRILLCIRAMVIYCLMWPFCYCTVVS